MNAKIKFEAEIIVNIEDTYYDTIIDILETEYDLKVLKIFNVTKLNDSNVDLRALEMLK